MRKSIANRVRLLSPPLATELLPAGNFRLLRDLIFKVDGRIFAIAEGDVTNWSSIPWWLRWVVRFNKVAIAGTVHDHGYEDEATNAGEVLTRREWDEIWRLLAQYGEDVEVRGWWRRLNHFIFPVNRANVVQAWAGYLGLRLFGWGPWNRYRVGG